MNCSSTLNQNLINTRPELGNVIMAIVVLWFLILGIGIFVYIAFPLIRGGDTILDVDPAETRMQTLYLEREQCYSALADLDEDYETGKLSDEDYQELRTALMQDTAQVVSQLEATAQTDVEAEIERFKQQKR